MPARGRYIGRKKQTNVTHEPINPATLYYDGSTKGGSRKQNRKTQCHQPHIATDPLAHQPTDRPNHQRSRTTAYPPTTCYSNTAVVPARTQRSIVERASSGPMGRVQYIYIDRLIACSDAPRSLSRSSVPVLSPLRQRTAACGGRGATARPREAKSSSGVAAVL